MEMSFLDVRSPEDPRWPQLNEAALLYAYAVAEQDRAPWCLFTCWRHEFPIADNWGHLGFRSSHVLREALLLKRLMSNDAVLRDEFVAAKQKARADAVWDPSDPALPPETCPYCGQYRQQRPGCLLDGHAACIVTDDFKRRVAAVLRSSPTMTYAVVAEMLGVTSGVVTSWWGSVVGNRVLIPVKRERAKPGAITSRKRSAAAAKTPRREPRARGRRPQSP